MKVKPSVKKLCQHCYATRDEGVYKVRCKKNRKHNQSQG